MKAAEDEVRADYPDDEFERTLVEDYIDIDVWRAFLFHRLSILKFSDLVLRPEISISSQEVEAYYQEHLADFTLPQREHFIVVDCDTKQTAEKLRKAYIQTRSQPLRNEDEDVNVREITANKERLPEPWLEALKGLKHKEASSIKSNEGRFQFIIFLDQLPEQVLDPASVYSRVEAGLMEGRMEQAFDAWLSEKVRKADIRVSQPLLEAWHKERSPETEEQDSYGLMGNVTAPAGDDDFYYDDEDQPEGGQI